MNTYSHTRPGAITAETMAEALHRHFCRGGQYAVAVLVHSREIDAAAAALLQLGLPLPVQVQPGVLVGEIGIR